MIAAHPVFAAIAGLVAGAAWLYNLNPAATEADKDRAIIEGAKKGTGGMVAGAIASNMQGRGVLGLSDAIFAATDVGVDPKRALRGALTRESERFNAAQKARIAAEKTQDDINKIAAASKLMELTHGITQRVNDAVAGGAIAKANVEVDARGSKITVQTQLKTDDPSRFADVALKSAFMGLTGHTLSATFGLGAPRLATGAP